MKAPLKFIHRVHALHKVEAVAVSLATAGAASTLKGVELGIPLDRWGLWADLVAGLMALAKVILARRNRGTDGEPTHGRRGGVQRPGVPPG